MPVLRITPDRAALLVVDVQQKLLPAMHNSDRLLHRCTQLIRGCVALDIPILATEQAPAKLGPTVEPVRSLLPRDTPIESKLKFSACVEPVRRHLSRIGRPIVIVCGIEAHVCVLQTALDLVAAGYVTAVCGDAIASRCETDRDLAWDRLMHAGIVPASVESVLLEMTAEAGTDRFTSILPIIRPRPPEVD